jgi:hypothetical protein
LVAFIQECRLDPGSIPGIGTNSFCWLWVVALFVVLVVLSGLCGSMRRGWWGAASLPAMHPSGGEVKATTTVLGCDVLKSLEVSHNKVTSKRTPFSWGPGAR